MQTLIQGTIKKMLPGYIVEIKKKIASPVSMSEFSIKGVGKATALKNLKLQKDFSGCYVLIEAKRPIYVGISRCKGDYAF